MLGIVLHGPAVHAKEKLSMKSSFQRVLLPGLLAVGIALALTGSPALAQDNQPPSGAPQQGPGGPGGRGGRRGPMNPDEQLARMTRRYNLTADQQSQIKPILENRMQQMMALRRDGSLSRDAMRSKMQGVRTDSIAKIEAVLNDDQKKKFDADQQRMPARQQQRQGGGPAASGPPPPQ